MSDGDVWNARDGTFDIDGEKTPCSGSQPVPEGSSCVFNGARPANPSPSLYFVPGIPHVMLIEWRQAPYFVPGLPHVVLIELRSAPLTSYQDYRTLCVSS